MNQGIRAVPERPPQAFLYLRQSVSRDDSVSLELQETAGRDYAARRGYEVVDVISDPGRSGRTLKRRQVVAMIERVGNREADVIVVWRWSRLSRNRLDFAVACDKVEALGGRIESATEPIDTRTASGRFARGMMAEFSAYESELKGEVWREIHARRRSNGMVAQGGQRFGYLHKRGTNTYTVDPTTGPILAEMYRRYIAGQGAVIIAKWLNEGGVPNRVGRPWRVDVVRRLLDSGFGAGLIIQGRKRRGSPPQWIQGTHPAVITTEEWDAYQRKRAVRAVPGKDSSARYMLTGYIKCGDCGFPMHPTKLGRETGYGYVCSVWAQTRGCRCVSVSRSKVEHAVFQFLRELAEDVDGAKARADKALEIRTVTRSETADLSRRIARADERLNRLTSGWTEGLVPDAAYRVTRDEITELRDRLARQLADVESRSAAIPVRPSVPLGVLDAWPQLPPDRQRAVLRSLVERVVVVRPTGEDGQRGMRRGVRVRIDLTWGESCWPLGSE